ncbi:MAG: hypothetical protein P8Y47_12480 [Alphaproteobacteria bacterium]
MASTIMTMSKKRTIEPRIGIDIGRVIMAPVMGGKADTSFLSGTLERAMETPPSPGAFESVIRLVTAFSGQAWLVSKAGRTVQQKTRAWLRHWDFHSATGLPLENVRFCLERAQKAHHCKQLKITHFTDDRLDVLEHLRGLVPHLFLFGEQPRLDVIPDWVMHVPDWTTATALVLESLEASGVR